MAETTQYIFSFQEVATALIKNNNIHDGLWGLYFEFGLSAANVGPGPEDLKPAAIIPVMKIGLQKFDQPSNLCVNAAEVNPTE
jgi:hypothetical protein